MGNNINLCYLLGLPEEVVCPKCGKLTRTFYDDYDIDEGDTEAIGNVLGVDCYCLNCEHRWTAKVKIEYIN